jgi:hypothetical protein
MALIQVRSQGEHPPRGGGAQAVGADQRTVSIVSGNFAWQEAGNQTVPNPGAVYDRLRQLWATPHGVIKAALANSGRVDGNTVTFSVDGREFKATLNAQNLVEKVSYLSTNEVVGDYPIDIAYTDYADFGRIKFPRHIVQTEEGHPTLDITVSDGQGKPPYRSTVSRLIALTAALALQVSVDALRWRVVFRYAERAQLGGRVRRSRGRGRRHRQRGALARGHGRDRQARPQQADPLRHQYPRPLRSRRRPPHLCGERGDRRHAREEQAVLRKHGRGRAHRADLSQSPRPAVFETGATRR